MDDLVSGVKGPTLSATATRVRDWLKEQRRPVYFDLFHEKSITNVFNKLVAFVDRMEQALKEDEGARHVGECVEAAAKDMNFLITGVKGVGKTTMALGIVNYLKAHPEHGILGVYVDCEDPKYRSGDKISATLCQHVRNRIGDTAFEALSINPDMDIVDLVSKVQDAAKLSFFIVVDEIQALYVPHGTPGRLEQQSLVYSFYKLGKGA